MWESVSSKAFPGIEHLEEKSTIITYSYQRPVSVYLHAVRFLARLIVSSITGENSNNCFVLMLIVQVLIVQSPTISALRLVN